MKLCRNCEHWYSTAQWKGNCRLHPWGKDQWSDTATPNMSCNEEDYVDKMLKYRVEAK